MLAILVALATAATSPTPQQENAGELLVAMQDDSIHIEDCNPMKGKDRWFECPEGSVTSFGYAAPSEPLRVLFVADSGIVFWLAPDVTCHDWMRNDGGTISTGSNCTWTADDTRHGIVFNISQGGRVNFLRAW